MKRLVLLLAGCATLGLAACDHPDAARQREAKTPKAVAKLDCPERQGQLKRVTAASDGLSCAYEGGGAEVTLKLLALNGTADETLKPLEAELKALMPAKAADPDAKVEANASAGSDQVDINLPGVRIKADDGGANIKVAGTEINANDNTAEVRVRSDENGFAARYILASESTGPWKVVGYEARGPEAGPLVVATVKKNGERETDGIFDDVSDLLKHTVGGEGLRGMHVKADAEIN